MARQPDYQDVNNFLAKCSEGDREALKHKYFIKTELYWVGWHKHTRKAYADGAKERIEVLWINRKENAGQIGLFQ